MSITTFSELQTAVANWSNRTDLGDRIPEFIALCEADMRVRCRLVDLEGSATVTVTSGSGSLPADFAEARSVYWAGDESRTLKYITPAQFDARRNETGSLPNFYTITGTSLKVDEEATGSAVVTYKAALTALSDSATTNTLLTRFPDAYLHGTLMQLCAYIKDAEGASGSALLYEAAIRRIHQDDNARRFSGQLTVRAR